jgi:hypothetical protein
MEVSSMPDWLWQFLASQALWEILLMIGVGALIARAKSKWPTIAPSILYGVAGATLVGVILFTLTGRGILTPPPQKITPENVEENIRTWVNEVGLSVKVLADTQSPPGSIFTVEARFDNGDPVYITRLKSQDVWLVIHSTLTVSSPHADMLGKLTPEKANEISNELNLEMARTHVSYTYDSPLKVIHVEKRILLTSATREGLITAVNDIDFAVSIARDTIIIGIERAMPQVKGAK